MSSIGDGFDHQRNYDLDTSIKHFKAAHGAKAAAFNKMDVEKPQSLGASLLTQGIKSRADNRELVANGVQVAKPDHGLVLPDHVLSSSVRKASFAANNRCLEERAPMDADSNRYGHLLDQIRARDALLEAAEPIVEAAEPIVIVQQPQKQGPSFSQQASKMQKLGALFCVLGGLLLIGTVVTGYRFHATQFSKDHFVGYISLLTVGGVAGMGTLFLGIYLLRKPCLPHSQTIVKEYHADDLPITDPFRLKKMFKNENPENQEDPAYWVYPDDIETIKMTLKTWIKDKGFIAFINEFGWKPIELEYLTVDDRELGLVKMYEANIQDPNRQGEIAQFNEAHQAQLKRFGFIR